MNVYQLYMIYNGSQNIIVVLPVYYGNHYLFIYFISLKYLHN